MNPTEQEDRLGEQLGSQPYHRQHPSRSVDQDEERLQSSRRLVGLRADGEQSRHALSGEIESGSTDEDPEANQNPLLRRRAVNQEPSMPVEQHQIEDPLDQTSDPLANAGSRDSVAAGHRRNRLALVDVRHRPQDVLYPVDLARKQLAGQNALARSTSSTPRQPDAHPPVAGGRQYAPLDPAAGQAESVTPAAGADTTAKNRVIRARHNRGIESKIHWKYVGQPRTSKTAPGFVAITGRGRRFFMHRKLDHRSLRREEYVRWGVRSYGMRFSKSGGHDNRA
jgi:hypothetical protein